MRFIPTKPSYFFLGHRLLSTQPSLGDFVLCSRSAFSGTLAPISGATTFHLSSSSEERLQSPRRQLFLIPERRKPIFDADKLLKRIEISFYSFIGIKIALNRGYLVFLKRVKHQYFFQLTRLWRVYSKYNSNQKFVKEKIEKIYIFLTIFPLPSEQITV